MNAETWFQEQLKTLQDDPEFLTEEVLLDITELIYRRMEDCGIRPAELARRLGVSRAFVSQLLNGKPNMTMRTLVGVAHALNQRVNIELRPIERERGRIDQYTMHVPAMKEMPEAVYAGPVAA